ncbi:MAG: glycosyltransferase family 39 protein [Ktedonobacteraceae bacterium]|nr:glycosyltransferase family 39 protein [Ktedonobacteraceae bacterium]
MADIADASTQVLVQGVTVRPGGKGGVSRLWERVALAAVLLLSIFTNFFLLGQGSYGNLYYAAGVRSMLDSLHNFFFVAYDPGSFVTVDKPPPGFWLQAISAKIFGFTPFSIFLPQALCGVAGIVAALALAVTPISVVTNRLRWQRSHPHRRATSNPHQQRHRSLLPARSHPHHSERDRTISEPGSKWQSRPERPDHELGHCLLPGRPCQRHTNVGEAQQPGEQSIVRLLLVFWRSTVTDTSIDSLRNVHLYCF